MTIRKMMLGVAASAIFWAGVAAAQKREIVWSATETPIREAIRGLRSLPDDVRAHTTKDLALKIRALPVTENKLRLAAGLAGLSTEGDFGHDTLEEVAATLASTLKERPIPWKKGEKPADEYMELASLARYEHVTAAALDDEQYHEALDRLAASDRQREHANFELKDLSGKTWTLSSLRGKVVLINFWATWCPPCRKEIPDLQALHERFESKGLVIVGISDEEAAKVAHFIHERKLTFPILLDPDRKANDAFVVYGIPKTFVYDRDGKLVAQSIDMRTQRQFLEMLALAGIQ